MKHHVTPCNIVLVCTCANLVLRAFCEHTHAHVYRRAVLHICHTVLLRGVTRSYIILHVVSVT